MPLCKVCYSSLVTKQLSIIVCILCISLYFVSDNCDITAVKFNNHKTCVRDLPFVLKIQSLLAAKNPLIFCLYHVIINTQLHKYNYTNRALTLLLYHISGLKKNCFNVFKRPMNEVPFLILKKEVWIIRLILIMCIISTMMSNFQRLTN